MAQKSDILLQVDSLTKIFARRGMEVHAVDNVSFNVARGETLGLVGESGSGKTTVGRCITRLIEPTAGKVTFLDDDISTLRGQRLRSTRKDLQMIFQDPASSLNPRMTVGGIIAEPLKVHFRMNGRQRRMEVSRLLERVGMSPAYASRYPHEFSGGQRQRIGIARAIATQPKLIICDEPVSALDVSIQAQILNLLADLQKELKLSYLFIAHNLAVVEHFADRIAVMKNGKIVESADKAEIYASPQNEYTRSLLASVPSIDPHNPHLAARKKPTV